MHKKILLLTLLFISICTVYAQNSDRYEDMRDSAITKYDIYNPILGGDSLRIINGIIKNGQQRDFWPNGQLKHNGHYENGRLIYYRNFYPDGQLERFFSARSSLKHRLRLYYYDGTLRSDVTFFKGESRLWIDYHPNGNMELYEEYHRSMKFYKKLESYAEDGSPLSSLELVNRRKQLFKGREYHPNGQPAEEGYRYFNEFTRDYQKTDTWLIYNQEGKLIAKEEYVGGSMISEEIL